MPARQIEFRRAPAAFEGTCPCCGRSIVRGANSRAHDFAAAAGRVNHKWAFVDPALIWLSDARSAEICLCLCRPQVAMRTELERTLRQKLARSSRVRKIDRFSEQTNGSLCAAVVSAHSGRLRMCRSRCCGGSGFGSLAANAPETMSQPSGPLCRNESCREQSSLQLSSGQERIAAAN